MSEKNYPLSRYLAAITETRCGIEVARSLERNQCTLQPSPATGLSMITSDHRKGMITFHRSNFIQRCERELEIMLSVN